MCWEHAGKKNKRGKKSKNKKISRTGIKRVKKLINVALE